MQISSRASLKQRGLEPMSPGLCLVLPPLNHAALHCFMFLKVINQPLSCNTTDSLKADSPTPLGKGSSTFSLKRSKGCRMFTTMGACSLLPLGRFWDSLSSFPSNCSYHQHQMIQYLTIFGFLRKSIVFSYFHYILL